ncbi:unnamed protein product, partial [marine sediment metagenome]
MTLIYKLKRLSGDPVNNIRIINDAVKFAVNENPQLKYKMFGRRHSGARSGKRPKMTRVYRGSFVSKSINTNKRE